ADAKGKGAQHLPIAGCQVTKPELQDPALVGSYDELCPLNMVEMTMPGLQPGESIIMNLSDAMSEISEEDRNRILTAIKFVGYKMQIINPARYNVDKLRYISRDVAEPRPRQTRYLCLAGTQSAVLCTMVGMVNFSELIDPPLQTTNNGGTFRKKSICIFPISQEWDRYVACAAKGLSINNFTIPVFQGGISLATIHEPSGLAKHVQSTSSALSGGRKKPTFSHVPSPFMKSATHSNALCRGFKETIPVFDLTENPTFNFA
ncbi:hypothetical protein BD410DRAFT_810832, partial [Rickenella mellea]